MGAETAPIRTGPTEELSLRVSIATLVRVVFPYPNEGKITLALERRATLLEQAGERQVLVKCQPFGGAVRILDLVPLQRLIGKFHFDSEQSRNEQDFRLFIRPADWSIIKEFCLQQFQKDDDSILESGPCRELAEEFSETMGVDLVPEQFTSRPLETVIEDLPSPTENSGARGYQTVRMYRIFEARMLDPMLCRKMVQSSERCSDRDLHKRAREDAGKGGQGWANAVLTLPLEQVMEFYLSLSPKSRDTPVVFMNHLLDETVSTILEGVSAPKYRLWSKTS